MPIPGINFGSIGMLGQNLQTNVVFKTDNVLCKPNKPGIKHYVKMGKPGQNFTKLYKIIQKRQKNYKFMPYFQHFIMAKKVLINVDIC